MSKSKFLIPSIDTFTTAGRYVPRGTPVSADEVNDPNDPIFVDHPNDDGSSPAVQASAIAPTGPNPTVPQQIAPGTVQTEAGYFDRGAKVVGEVTKPADKRFVEIVDDEDTTQGDVEAALAKAPDPNNPNATVNNNDDALVAGTVADVTARINADTSTDDLNRLRAAEADREQPRKGVLAAIDKELAAREEADANAENGEGGGATA